MFERYTELARRVIFFARYEANQVGASEIEAEYILLGLLREDKELILQFFNRGQANIESIRREIESHAGRREHIREQTDIPLSFQAKRALAYAAEESELLGNRHIGTEHLLLGLLRAEDTFAASILHDRGLRLADLRQKLMNEPTFTQHITQKFSVAESPPADRDEKWFRAISDASIDRGLFTQEDLLSECVQVAALRQFHPEAEALLRLLAAKGLTDQQGLPALAFELREDRGLASFLERLH